MNKIQSHDKIIKQCPHCKNRIFKEDKIHAQIYCATCGLILQAPMEYSIFPRLKVVFPGPRVIIKKKKEENTKKRVI